MAAARTCSHTLSDRGGESWCLKSLLVTQTEEQDFFHVCVHVSVSVSPLPPAKDIILVDLSISSPHKARFISHPGQSPGEVITDRENTGLPGRSLSEYTHHPLSSM